MKEHYMNRGYPSKHVEAARVAAMRTDRKDLLNPQRKKDRKNENIVPLVLTHHPSNPQVYKIIMKHWGMLNYSERCKAALPDKPLFTTRRGKNLRDMLIRAKLKDKKEPPVTNPPKFCSKDCKTCKQIYRCSICHMFHHDDELSDP